MSYTKKGPGRTHAVYKKQGNKLATKQVNHTVGLNNAVVSIVQMHFDEKSKERFLSKHN